MSIQQQAMIDADPAQVYAVLADAEALSALSGMSGAGGRSTGEEFSAFDGHVVGRQVELVPGERIVQAWRFPAWEPGTYAIVRFTVVPDDDRTRLVIEQHGEPADWHDHIDANWPTFYLTPLTEHFAAPAGASACPAAAAAGV
ncbi:MAG: SRPBCC domain-containing protein [Streptosporangiaceae bacterium]